MDILLDLWIHAIYKDEQVQGSEVGPVAYFRNGTGSPLIGYAELAERWGISKTTAGRMLKRLAEQEYISLLSFPGRHGSVIYLNNYLSTMFQVSDIIIDKEEVAMSLNINISIPDDTELISEESITEEQLCVPTEAVSVSKTHLRKIVQKVSQILSASGIACCECIQVKYKLYPLFPDCKEDFKDYRFVIACGETELYHFELRIDLVT